MTKNRSGERHTSLNLSIVIATINRHPQVDQCLQSIDKALQRNKHLSCEVIIVDQSTHLYTAARSHTFPVTVIAAAPGASHARNIGLKRSSGDYVWFLDDDAIVVRFAKFSSAEMDAESMLFARWKERPCPPRRYLNGGLLSSLWLIRTSGTPFYLLPRSLAARVGGFDEQLGPGRAIAAGEDLDLLLRARPLAAARQPVIYIAELSHPNTPPSAYKRKLYAHARGVVLARYQWHLVMAVELIYSLVATLRGDQHRFVALLKGYAAGRRARRGV
jgi:glycosyltransferase involved in cell wall biosynthesis